MSGESAEPPEIVHDPSKYAIRWARAVLWQGHRLREGMNPPGPAAGIRPSFVDRVAIEQHFLLTACVQLSRALDALGDDIRLPASVRERLAILRNVREHWDEWHIDKGSSKRFRELWPDKSPYTLTKSEQDILLGGIASLSEIELVVDQLLKLLLQARATV